VPHRIAFLPLNTYPEAAPDQAVLAASDFAWALGCELHVATFALDIPRTRSPVSDAILAVEGLARATEQRSKVECERLRALVEGVSGPERRLHVTSHLVGLGAGPDAAAIEARYFDLTLLPWSSEMLSTQEMAQAIVFGSGLPVVIVPPLTAAGIMDHIAIAWDESRVAARALNDALQLLRAGGQVSVLTVGDEKVLSGSGLSRALTKSLENRGYDARAVNVSLKGRNLGAALQDEARAAGAQLLAMGGFGHSRLRDFILGGATRDVLGDLRMPVLLAH